MSRMRLFYCFLAVVAVAIGVTLSAWENPFILDDVTKIIENPDIRLLSNLPGKLLYPYHAYQVFQRNDPSRPLVYLIYTLVYSVVGLQPWLYHLVGGVLHGLSAGLVFLLAWRLQSRFSDENKTWPSLLAALFFALSPIQVGTANYAYALSDVVSTFFMFLSVWIFLNEDWLKNRAVTLSVVAMALALLAKQSAIVVPALLILWDWVEGDRWKNWKRYLPHVALAGAYLAFRFIYFGGIGDLESYAQEHPWRDYFVAQPWVLFRYVALCFVPIGLAIDHWLYPALMPMWQTAFGWIFWLAVTGLVLRSKNRIVLFAFFWFLICLAPTSSIVPTVDLMVERRVYAGALGVFVLLLIPFERVSWRRPALIVSTLVLVCLGVVSLHRNTLYSSADSVWRDVLKTYPVNQRALNSLSNILSAKGEFAEAQQIYEKTIALYPNDFVAHGNFGALLERDDNPGRNRQRALELFKESARLNPTVAESYYNIGRLLQVEGRGIEALPYYAKAIELKPNFYPAMNNTAVIELAQGHLDRAKELLETTLRLDPQYQPAIGNLRAVEAAMQKRSKTK